MGVAWALFGIALGVALAGFGSAIGIYNAVQVAAGAMSEDPKNFGKYLVLIALPGTQGIYGFACGFLFFLNLNALSFQIPFELGWKILFGMLPIGLAGLVSGIFQGKACAAGINMVTKQPGESGKAIIMAVFIEFYAVLGFVISFFAWLWLF